MEIIVAGLQFSNLDAPSLLLVDDDDVFREVMQRALAKRGFAVSTARDVAGAIALAEDEVPEHAVVDLGMPGPSGFWLVRRLRELSCQTRVIVVSGWDRERAAIDAIRYGATHYLTKPVSIDDILAALGFIRGLDVRRSLEQTMPHDAAAWRPIEKAMQENGDDIAASAGALGMHPRGLRRILRWAGRDQ